MQTTSKAENRTHSTLQTTGPELTTFLTRILRNFDTVSCQLETEFESYV